MKRNESGVTYIELVATTAILMIVASAVLPMARTTQTRAKELELRRALRELRGAIDLYRLHCDEQISMPKKIEPCRPPYPQKLEDLVEGKPYIGELGGSGAVKFKALRRIPMDPMTGTDEWGLRCAEDDPDSTSWCGSNVWDVYTKSNRKALDGTRYKDW